MHCANTDGEFGHGSMPDRGRLRERPNAEGVSSRLKKPQANAALTTCSFGWNEMQCCGKVLEDSRAAAESAKKLTHECVCVGVERCVIIFFIKDKH